MTLIDTLNYFIEAEQAELTDLEWQIKEETNYEENNIEDLSDWYDCVKQRLEDLEIIKNIIENQ
jgi:uncharacterized protein YfkK (UPF0435 family)